jgi:hypothetical protein
MRQLTFGALVSQAISVIARFGVADTLAAGPRQVDDIAGLVGAHGPALYRLLRALGDVGVVAELEDRQFALTPVGELLRSDVPGSLRGWATMVGMPFHRYPGPTYTRRSVPGNRRLTGSTARRSSSIWPSTPKTRLSSMRP